jgi:hypothetical protein
MQLWNDNLEEAHAISHEKYMMIKRIHITSRGVRNCFRAIIL